jgi:hypothetical protein
MANGHALYAGQFVVVTSSCPIGHLTFVKFNSHLPPAAALNSWLRAFATNVSQIHDVGEEDPVEMKVDRETREAAN